MLGCALRWMALDWIVGEVRVNVIRFNGVRTALDHQRE